jgi:transposase
MHPIRYPPRAYMPRPWAPLTRIEFDELARFLPGLDENARGRGRKRDNPRRTMDAIFWIACAKGPWRTLPPELGKADSAHRLLRRWAIRGDLGRLLTALSAHPLDGGTKLLRSMGYWICRAYRRMARCVHLQDMLVTVMTNLVTAWPAAVMRLPNRRHQWARAVRWCLVRLWAAAAQAVWRLVAGGLPARLVPVAGLVASVRGTCRWLRRWLDSSNGNRREWRTW